MFEGMQDRKVVPQGCWARHAGNVAVLRHIPVSAPRKVLVLQVEHLVGVQARSLYQYEVDSGLSDPGVPG